MTNKKIVVYGASWCGPCQKMKAILVNAQIEHEFKDIDEDPALREYVKSIQNTIPLVQIEDPDRDRVVTLGGYDDVTELLKFALL